MPGSNRSARVVIETVAALILVLAAVATGVAGKFAAALTLSLGGLGFAIHAISYFSRLE